MKQKDRAIFENCPVIAALKSLEQLDDCLKSQSEVVFFLCGDVCNIASIVEKAKAAGKFVVVHLDLINGLSASAAAADFIKQFTKADGVISTRPQTIKHAHAIGLFTVLRLFMLDSLALDNVKKQVQLAEPDMIEILPGCMPKVIEKICTMTSVPLIAGGLILDKSDIVSALNSGASCISTTKKELWYI